MLAARLLQARCVFCLELGDLVRGLTDAVQCLSQLSILGLRAFQQLQEGLDLATLSARAMTELLLQFLNTQLHLLAFSALLFRLFLVLIDNEQKFINLLFCVIDVQFLLAGKFLYSSPCFSRLSLQHFHLIRCCYEFHLHSFHTHREIFLVLEQLRDELKRILHHVCEFLLLFLQGVLEFRLEDVFQFIE